LQAECHDVDTMRLDLAAKELRENGLELRKQYRLKALRQRLKFLLIGFLIGRHADEKIRSLTARNELVIKEIKAHFEELLTVCKQINENADTGSQQYLASLTALETNLKWLIASRVLEEEYVLPLKETVEALRRSILEYVEVLVRHRMEMMKAQVQEIQNSSTYLMRVYEEHAVASVKSIEDEIVYFETHNLLELEFVSSSRQVLQSYRKSILDYNKKFIEGRKKEYSHLFNKGNLSLDDEQQTAVITDDKHNLVIAGAGAGKTEVLITRIAYLIDRKPDTVKPDRILAIAFQDKAKREIEERLRDRYKISGVNVRTFHKLGKEIIEKARGRRISHTDIVDENKKSDIVKRIYEQLLNESPGYYKLFLNYVRTFRDNERQENADEKEDSLALKLAMRYVSINNKQVKSRAEKEILDFFLTHKLNGESIEVEYEPEAGKFLPDFRLPKFDLFIEHWSFNEKGEVPEYYGPNGGEEYKRIMEGKKEYFAREGKLLVETYAYEYDENDPEGFIEELKQRVIEKLRTRWTGEFEFSPMSYDEVVEVAWAPYRDPTPDHIVNFIKNAKVYDFSPERIEERLREKKWSRKQLIFGRLALEVYRVYEQELREQGKIDFEDMINLAVDELREDGSLYADVYDHILVDEYQDISKQRRKLIAELLGRNEKCKLFCVGDDWQSIMGFAGSNLSFFVNFAKYFEKPAVTKISTNYRSIKSIVDAGAALIKNNGSCQIPKRALAYRQEARPIWVLRSTHDKDFETQYYQQIVDDCLNRISNYIRRGYEPRDILVLNRYRSSYVVKNFIERAKEKNIGVAFDSEFARRNQIRLMTVHKSKGLEAKVVFILNAIKGTYGFPCEIEDSSIYAAAREDYPNQDQKEEERRLFYVAVTRAKEDLTIYTWEPSESEFLEEIKDHINEEPLYY